MIVTRLIVGCFSAWSCEFRFPFPQQFHHRNFFENKVRQRFLRIIRSPHLNSEPDALLILPGQVEGELPIVREIQPATTLLHLAPSRAEIDLLSQGKPYQVFDRLRNIVGLDLCRTHVGGDVRYEPFTEVGHNLGGRGCCHHHVATREYSLRWVLRKGPLIQTIGDSGAVPKIISVPIVGGNISASHPGAQASRRRRQSPCFKEASSVHPMPSFSL